jgi:hypothetical protein
MRSLVLRTSEEQSLPSRWVKFDAVEVGSMGLQGADLDHVRVIQNSYRSLAGCQKEQCPSMVPAYFVDLGKSSFLLNSKRATIAQFTAPQHRIYWSFPASRCAHHTLQPGLPKKELNKQKAPPKCMVNTYLVPDSDVSTVWTPGNIDIFAHCRYSFDTLSGYYA